jgi:hypothetical protein
MSKKKTSMNCSFTGVFLYLRKLCPQQENSALLQTGSYVRMTVMMTGFFNETSRSLLATYTCYKITHRSSRLLTDELQLIYRGKMATALVAGLHFECAPPDLSLGAEGLHDDVFRRAYIRAGSAADTNH